MNTKPQPQFNRVFVIFLALVVVIMFVYLLAANLNISWKGINPNPEPQPMVTVLSFADCAKAGYPVMESYPRQCKTLDGRTFAEEIAEKFTYNNASADLIVVDLPFPGAVVGKDFTVTGKARGGWFFEANAGLEVLDKNGKSLVRGNVQAQGEWMTQDPVPFRGEVKISQSYIGPATLILRNDNPSDLPQNEKSVSFPITIEY